MKEANIFRVKAEIIKVNDEINIEAINNKHKLAVLHDIIKKISHRRIIT